MSHISEHVRRVMRIREEVAAQLGVNLKILSGQYEAERNPTEQALALYVQAAVQVDMINTLQQLTPP